MPKPLDRILALIEQKKTPKVILVGGTSDYLSEQAFRSLRDAIVAAHAGITVESYEAGAELPAIVDSYRTMSLFASARLLIVPEVNAFVSAKEIASLFDKAVSDWKSAKTDRKRASSSAKLLHVLGLAGCDLEMTDAQIARAIGVSADQVLIDMLAFCRATGKKAGRGEDDAALLMDAIAHGGASGAYLLLRTGEIPRESATVDLIDREGAVVIADVARESFLQTLEQIVSGLAAEAGVRFEPTALARLRHRLGIERMLADKFSKDVPDLRSAASEAERLITLAGSGGRVTVEMVDREIASVEGGARYELASLFTEGKHLEAVVKLRELVAQARREDPKTPLEIQYGRFLFPLADEIRQMIGIRAFAKMRKIDLRTPMNYNRFKDTVADQLGDYLKQAGIVRQRPHPFPLQKKWEACRNVSEVALFRALADLAELEIQRKSGGLPIDVGLETFLLARARG
jgi:DNA polymerase III delta subunit